MTAYAKTHYGIGTYKLHDPRVIVEHYTETGTFGEVYNLFAADVPDSELHERPGLCAHFVIDRDGTHLAVVIPRGSAGDTGGGAFGGDRPAWRPSRSPGARRTPASSGDL